MKAMLKKILFISLFFSAVVPSAMQANLLNWAALRNGVIESAYFLTKYGITDRITVEKTVIGIAFLWSLWKIKEEIKKNLIVILYQR